MEKITFCPEDGEAVEFFVLEQTRLGGVDYILVTDSEDDDAEALILKDVSAPEDEEAIYSIVDDDKEWMQWLRFLQICSRILSLKRNKCEHLFRAAQRDLSLL